MSDPSKIEEMIAAEPDQKNRAFLLILNNINKALVENTETTRNVAGQLEAHIREYKAHAERDRSLFDQGRGAWKIAAWIFGILQLIGLGMWSDAQKEQKEIRLTLQQDQVMHARFDQRLEILERKKP